MKKICALLMSIILILLTTTTCMAEDIPEEISAFFDDDRFENSTLLQSVYIDCKPLDGCWFCLIRNNEGNNELFHFKLKNGLYINDFSTTNALPQAEKHVTIYPSYSFCKIDEITINDPFLYIVVLDDLEEDVNLSTCYQFSESGIWKLFNVYSHEDFHNMIFSDDSVTSYGSIEGTSVMGVVYGHFQRDLQKIKLNEIPHTLSEAYDMVYNQHVQSLMD